MPKKVKKMKSKKIIKGRKDMEKNMKVMMKGKTVYGK